MRERRAADKKNQQSPNERSRENISLFAFCFPCPSCSPQEMLPLSFAKDCLYSLILVPSFDKWRPPPKNIYICIHLLVFSDSFKVKVVHADLLLLLNPITGLVKMFPTLPFAPQQHYQDQKHPGTGDLTLPPLPAKPPCRGSLSPRVPSPSCRSLTGALCFAER